MTVATITIAATTMTAVTTVGVATETMIAGTIVGVAVTIATTAEPGDIGRTPPRLNLLRGAAFAFPEGRTWAEL